MVKFSKELEAQIIPEWREKFVNYRVLKKQIKRIKLSRLPKTPQDVNGEFGLSIFDPIRYLTNRIYNKFLDPDNKTDIIQVRSKNMEDREEEVYETELSQLFSEEDEVKMFFAKLDDELNKVNQFYKKTEGELLEREETLNKQLQILADLKQILDDRHRKSAPPSPNSLNSPRSWLSPARSSNSSEGSIELAESPISDHQSLETEEAIASSLKRNGVSFDNSETKTKQGKHKMAMKINIPATATATTRAIAALTSILSEDFVNNPRKELGPGEFLSRKKVQCAEKTIRSAFVELYKGLGLLKTYSSLNMVAFSKILKKFDKVSNQQASTNYLKAVKETPFIGSGRVVRLMDDVEIIFTKHFANNDRKKAMKFLRPQQPKTSHMLTFFVGLFTGCFVSLFIIYALLAHLSGIFSSSDTQQKAYMETVYPVFSIIALLSLHLFMYGCNLFMWKSKRINYNFIFEFTPTTSLKYRDAFLICTTFMTTVVGVMVVHLFLRATDVFHPRQVDTIPGILVLFFIAVLICPFDIFYRPTRYCFLRIIRNIVCSPFYKVALVDIFMADQLTSQIPLLRHMESSACYFLAGNFKTHPYSSTVCDAKSGRLFLELAYVISFFPYFWRAMQCARRWFDDCNADHLANMGKYVSAMAAAGARLTLEKNNDKPRYLWFAILTSVVATLYQLYWDFVKDWGLLNYNSKNLWLRDDLILKKKCIYYISMAFNIVLRVAWVESVITFPKKRHAEKQLLDFVLASFEVIRRGHWNFYRLENEHLNNVGNYKAVKEVPLPFRETDSDG